MKKFLCLILILTACFYAGINYYFSEKKPRVFRIGSECNYVPNNWEEKTKTDTNVPISNKEGSFAEGYDIQIAKNVAKSMGAELEVVKLPWQYLIEALNKHEIDAIFSGMLDTKARRKMISFSDVYDIHTASYGIMVHKNGKYSGAKTLKDFIGASILAQKDTNADRAIAQIKGAIHLPAVMKIQDLFDKLRNKEADAIILDLEQAQTYERVYPGFEMIKFSKENDFKFDFTGICAGVRIGDTKLLKEINEALKNISGHDRQKIMDQSVSRNWNHLQ